MRLWYLSPRQPAKAQASLRIRTLSPEPSLFAHMKYGSKQRVRPKIRHLAPLDGWLRMRIWRMSLQRTKSAIISWAGSFDLYHDLCPSMHKTTLHGVFFSFQKHTDTEGFKEIKQLCSEAGVKITELQKNYMNILSDHRPHQVLFTIKILQIWADGDNADQTAYCLWVNYSVFIFWTSHCKLKPHF